MIYGRISRRYFLQGLGTSLMIPFLPSVMNKAYAAGFPVRYVQMFTPYGNPGGYYFPATTAFTQTASGIYTAPLAGIAGDLSPMFGASFSGLKNKMSLVRGLHVLPKDSF